VNDSYFFISDIHLGLQSREKEKKKERLLVDLLEEIGAANAKELFIVGDLFDYWFEYRKVYQKGFFRTLTALQDLTDNGIAVSYIIGNHDFMHRDFFADEIGCKMYEDGIERIIDNKKFFIAHGDGLIKNDYGYNILKKILRNKTLQNIYSLLHPDIGVALASKSSKTSREYTSQKDYGEADGLLQAARLKIDEGYDYVLFGHLHKKRFELYKNGCYINLGSWLEQPCYGLYKDNKFEIVDFFSKRKSDPEK
jgi:UDP-2,3-diacylglucosamine hydrolase